MHVATYPSIKIMTSPCLGRHVQDWADITFESTLLGSDGTGPEFFMRFSQQKRSDLTMKSGDFSDLSTEQMRI